MVAAVAAKIGMKCRLVQEAWVPHEDAVYDRVGNILLTRIMGADVRLVDDGFDIGIRKSWEEAIEEVKAAGGKPYAIPAGASVHKYGGLGYVGFAEEVRTQEKRARLQVRLHHRLHRHRLDPCRHAGRLRRRRPRAQGDRHRRVLHAGADQGAGARRSRRTPPSSSSSARTSSHDDVVLIEDYAYPAYGVPSEETKEAIRLAARLEGMITDPVYEGKSMQGMIDLAQKGFFPKGVEGALRPSRRRAGAERLRLRVPERLRARLYAFAGLPGWDLQERCEISGLAMIREWSRICASLLSGLPTPKPYRVLTICSSSSP